MSDKIYKVLPNPNPICVKKWAVVLEFHHDNGHSNFGGVEETFKSKKEAGRKADQLNRLEDKRHEKLG